MSINPKTLDRLMKEKGLTQAALKAQAGVSVKSILRALKGGTTSNKNTVDRISRALGVKPEALAANPDNQHLKEVDDQLKASNYHRASFYVSGVTSLNFALVEERYGMSQRSLIDAAPLLFTILAELSLARRKDRLSAYEDAFAAALNAAPEHLLGAFRSDIDFNAACMAEAESIRRNDLSGRLISEDEGSGDDLFVSYLTALSACVDPGVLDLAGGVMGSIDHVLLSDDLDRITNGDSLAKIALEHRHVRLSEIPANLRGEDRGAERAAWLTKQIPQAAREKHEALIAELGRMLIDPDLEKE